VSIADLETALADSSVKSAAADNLIVEEQSIGEVSLVVPSWAEDIDDQVLAIFDGERFAISPRHPGFQVIDGFQDRRMERRRIRSSKSANLEVTGVQRVIGSHDAPPCPGSLSTGA